MAQTRTSTWVGETAARPHRGSWAKPDNWSPSGVPDANTHVVIPPTLNSPTISDGMSVTIHSISIESGALLEIQNPTLKVTVNQDITIHHNATVLNFGSDFIVNGNWVNNGNYTEEVYKLKSTTYYPTIEFGGNAKTIGGTSVTNFNNVVMRGAITLNAPINIKPILGMPSKLEVVGALDPGLNKISFTTTPSEGFIVGDQGTIKVKAPTFDGNYGLPPSSMYVSSTIDYAANGDQTVKAITYGRLTISGSGTKSLEGNTTISPVSALTQLNVLAGTLDLKTFSLSRSGSGAVTGGTLSVANGASLNIGGTGTFPSGFAARDLGSTSTVTYYGGAQTVSNEMYGNLTLSGSEVKTLPTAVMALAGKLTGSGSASFTARAGLTIAGDVELNEQAVFNGASFTHTVGGNWTNNATFSGGTSTVVMNGTAKKVARTASGAATFHNLTISGVGTQILAPALTITGNLTTTNAGSFSQTTGGIISMTGTSKSIAGSGIIFQDLSVSGSVSTAATFQLNGNITVATSGNFTATAGTINLTGSNKSISNAGSLIFSSIRVNGTLSSTSSFHINADVSGAGKLTATAGVVTFSGASSFAGAHDLYDVTVSGAHLRMVANANLGIARNLTVQPGSTFDAVTNRPNTVTFNGSEGQSIPALIYHHLAFDNAGTKIAAAALTANGNMSIGAASTFRAGAYSHSIAGNWVNNGTFNHDNGSITFNGGANTTITGATTFHVLSLDKLASSNTVTQNNEITTATLSLTSGVLVTGLHKVTVTNDRSGSGWVLGTIRRNHAFVANTPYAFNGPYAQLTFGTVTGVTEVSTTQLLGAITDFPAGAAVNGVFTVAIPFGSYANATLQAQYIDTEINGNSEEKLHLFRKENSVWTDKGRTQANTTENWVNKTELSNVTGTWTLSSATIIFRWKGGTSTAWEDVKNWENVANNSASFAASTPGITDEVELGGVAPVNQPVISSDVKVKVMRFKGVAPIALHVATGSLTVTNNLAATGTGTNTTHTINLGTQNLTVGGSLIMNDGSLGNSLSLNLGSGNVTVAEDLQHGTGAISLGSGHFKLRGNFLNANMATFAKGTGTFTYEGDNSQIIGVVYYNHLTIDKSAGVATLTAPAEGYVAGVVTIKGGTLSIPGGTYTLEQDVVQTGGIMEVGNSTITVMGNWTKTGGVFEANTSTVTLKGSQLAASSLLTFNNLNIDKPQASTLTVTGEVLVNSTLELKSGIVDLGIHTLKRSATGGRFVMGDAASLLLGDSNFPASFSNYLLAPGSTVTYQGTGIQNVAPVTYGNLVFENGSTASKELQAATTVAGNLTIANGATVNANGKTLTLHGDFNKAGEFTAGPSYQEGTLVLASTGGVPKKLSGHFTHINNMLVESNAHYVLEAGNLTVNGDFVIHGHLDGTLQRITFQGNYLNDGNLKGSGVAEFTGTRLQNIQLKAPMVAGANGAPTVEFNGSIAPVFNSTTAPVFGGVVIGNTDPAGIRASVGWTVTKSFEVKKGATFSAGSYTHHFYNSIQNAGTILSEGTINFSPTQSVPDAVYTLNFGTNADAFKNTGLLRIAGNGQVVLTGSTPNIMHDVALENTHPSGLSTDLMTGAKVLITGDVTVAQGTTFYGGTKEYTISGDLTNNGVIDARNADLIFTATDADPGETAAPALISGTGLISVRNFTVAPNARITLNKDSVEVYGNFIHAGTSFDGTKSGISFRGEDPAVISAPGNASINIKILKINKTVDASVTLQAPISEVTSLAIASGTFNAQNQAITTREATELNFASSFSIKDGASFRVSGNELPTFTTYAFAPTSTVVYEGMAQTIKSTQYGHLQLLNSGVKTFTLGTVQIAGNFTVSAEAVVTVPELVQYNGTGMQTVVPLAYNNLALSNAGVKSLAPGTTSIANELAITESASLFAAAKDVTVDYNGAVPQAVAPTNYFNLTLRNGGTKTFSGTTGIAAAFTLADGATADLLTHESTIDFNGAAAQNIPALAYKNLTSSAVSVKTLLGSATVEKQLLLTAGEVKTGNHKITLGEAAGTLSETGTSYVTGTVETQRVVSAGIRETFGGMGLAITAASSPGLTVVTRTTGKAVGLNQNSILRSFIVEPTGTNANLDAQVEFTYFTHELNNTAEDNLAFYASTDGKSWIVQPEEKTTLTSAGKTTRSSAGKTASLTGVSSLRQFTLGDRNNPLPVTLISFTGKSQKEGVLLNWATASEKDNDYFQVERSTDGKNFNTVGKVNGNGTSNVQLAYRFLDGHLASGTTYYRLKQVDFDGKFEYSKVVAVQTKAPAMAVTVNVYPNPTTGLVNLDLTRVTATQQTISVYALDGRLVKQTQVLGGAVQSLDLSDLAIGTYLLKVTGPEIEAVTRVVRH